MVMALTWHCFTWYIFVISLWGAAPVCREADSTGRGERKADVMVRMAFGGWVGREEGV